MYKEKYLELLWNPVWNTYIGREKRREDEEEKLSTLW